MKYKIASLIAGVVLSMPMAVSSQQQHPYSCVWTSQINSNAKIQFTASNGIGGYQGAVYYGDKWIINISEGNSQGYGSNWWQRGSLNEDKPGKGNIVVFKNGAPARSTVNRQPRTETRLLIVGLGSTLHYGNQRSNRELIRAAEGFWIPSQGCRHLNDGFG